MKLLTFSQPSCTVIIVFILSILPSLEYPMTSKETPTFAQTVFSSMIVVHRTLKKFGRKKKKTPIPQHLAPPNVYDNKIVMDKLGSIYSKLDEIEKQLDQLYADSAEEVSIDAMAELTPELSLEAIRADIVR